MSALPRSPAPPAISPPIVEGTRPFWSVVIPTYNRTTFLEKTLTSVLTQDPGPEEMQIEVLDNASTECDPGALVRRVGGGRVSFVRHPRNLGPHANHNGGIERARGEWVHILHDDDYVLPGFYARLRAGVEGREEVGAAFCRHSCVDENERQLWVSDLESPEPGILPDFIAKIGVRSRVQFPSIVIRRSAYTRWGGFRPELMYSADWEMWTRIAAHYPVWYEPEILAVWRAHPKTLTTDLKGAGRTFDDLYRCIEISRQWLPDDQSETISRQAREYVFFWSLRDVTQEKAVEQLIAASRAQPYHRSWLPRRRSPLSSQGQREWLLIRCLDGVSEPAARLRLTGELLKVSMPAPIHRSAVAHLALSAAGVCYRQGRRWRALLLAGCALLTRPLIAARPFKRALNFLLHKTPAETS